jgi:hypothetical protein
MSLRNNGSALRVLELSQLVRLWQSVIGMRYACHDPASISSQPVTQRAQGVSFLSRSAVVFRCKLMTICV